MKVSLWQQFSSNNSVSYLVIGVFETPTAAQEIKDFFEEMIRDIIAHRHPPPMELRVPPEKIQQKHAGRYAIELDEDGLEWLNAFKYYSPDQHINTQMTLVDRFLLIHPSHERQSIDAERLRDFVGALGATSYVRVGSGGDFHFRLLCTAPDTETATVISQAVEWHLQRSQHVFFVPSAWARHELLSQAPALITPEQYEGLQQLWHAWYDMAHQLDLSTDEIASQRWQLAEIGPFLGPILWSWSSRTLDDIGLKQDGTRIIFEETTPKRAEEFEPTFSAIHHWLESLGCDVTYEFIEDRE
jgi:hypothetical protein